MVETKLIELFIFIQRIKNFRGLSDEPAESLGKQSELVNQIAAFIRRNYASIHHWNKSLRLFISTNPIYAVSSSVQQATPSLNIPTFNESVSLSDYWKIQIGILLK